MQLALQTGGISQSGTLGPQIFPQAATGLDSPLNRPSEAIGAH